MAADNFEKIYEEYRQQSEQQARMEANANQSSSNGKEEFVAVRKNDDGDIIAFKTNSGRELDYITALEEAKVGNIAHIDVFHKYGRDIIRSEPDGIKENNLDQLPEF
jgi:transcriptional antiterminator Rof (Rho-off)